MEAKTLSPEDVKVIIKILKRYFINIYKLIFILDQKQADTFKQKNTYYYQQWMENDKHKNKSGHSHSHQHEQQSGCCGSFFSKIYIPEKERSGLEVIVSNIFAPISLRSHLPTLLEYLQVKFNRIKSSGQKDKLSWTQDAEIYVLNEVMREGVQLYFKDEIRKLMQREQFVDSKQPMLLATPNTWKTKHPNIPLEFLEPTFIESLMKKGYGVQFPFVKNKDFARALFKECDFLERDGRFEEPLQEQGIREDKILWVTLSEIEKNAFKNIYFIANILSALPYELNAKTQLFAQISECFQISYFNEQRSQHKKHLDSSFDKGLDTGKKVSFFYIAVDPDNEDTGTEQTSNFTIFTDSDSVEVKIEQDMLIGLMSRRIPYSINISEKKVIVLRFWVDGPFDSNQNY